LSIGSNKSQTKDEDKDNVNDSHKGENCHSKNTTDEELEDNEKLTSNLKTKIKEELEKVI
jgi:hypothetical protein